jgi:hypothetical protein
VICRSATLADTPIADCYNGETLNVPFGWVGELLQKPLMKNGRVLWDEDFFKERAFCRPPIFPRILQKLFELRKAVVV